MPYQFASESKDYSDYASGRVFYGAPGHPAFPVRSVERFRRQLRQFSQTHQVNTHLFRADATHSQEIVGALAGRRIDMVISDVPYGQRSHWHAASAEASSTEGSLWQMLDALLTVLSVNAVVAIVANKAQKCDHRQYRKSGRFQIGKRHVFLLEPA